ncbi:MAG TPA: hypothetical protein VEI83_03860 [Acidimicrobiales bacterium]|nr:hypothetical protein [Acidimicrobiales bacterium]
MELTAGSRWKSAVCDTEVVVVRPPDAPAHLGCGGADMVPLDAERTGGDPDPAYAGGTQMGKRYADEASGLEVLCTKAGAGTLTLDGTVIELKGAKPLPSSD